MHEELSKKLNIIDTFFNIYYNLKCTFGCVAI